MPTTSQREYWNQVGGTRWVLAHTHFDGLLSPFRDALIERAELHPGQHVVDVGCGAGAITRAAAARCGAGRVRGVDISAPLLELARRLSEQASPGSDEPKAAVEFIEADATEFRPDAPVDRVLSRFGIMFFERPDAAFANIRSWLSPNGMMVALCWQAGVHNPWLHEPLQVLAAHMPLPKPDPNAPGPLSLADPERVQSLLSRAGFGRVGLEDLPITMRVDGDKAAILAFYREWGPAARFYAEATPEQRTAITRGLEALVDRNYDGTGLSPRGRAWVIRARKSN